MCIQQGHLNAKIFSYSIVNITFASIAKRVKIKSTKNIYIIKQINSPISKPKLKKLRLQLEKNSLSNIVVVLNLWL